MGEASRNNSPISSPNDIRIGSGSTPAAACLNFTTGFTIDIRDMGRRRQKNARGQAVTAIPIVVRGVT
jgi:hypothetical protein